jgi:arsenate reductase (glutaredoxin)
MPSNQMPDMVRIYHNTRCSKSRGACEIIGEKGIDAEIIEYLKTPPTEAELREILGKLGMKASEIVRKGEDIYKAKFAANNYSEEEWIKILSENPILIERPIIVNGDQAVIGRPLERINEILKQEF